MYHLYFGNETASTSLFTFFPINDGIEGKIGNGQVAITVLAINKGTIDFWIDRLNSFGIKTSTRVRFGKKRIAFEDLDGLKIELVEEENPPVNTWEFNGVGGRNTISGVHSAVLYSGNVDETLEMFTEMLGYKIKDENNGSYLLTTEDDFGDLLEISKVTPGKGRRGIGTVHHIAFKVNDDEIYEWERK